MSQTHQRPRASSTLLTVAAFVVVVAGLRAAEPIVVSFLLSVFLAIISAPPLFWLESRGLPKWLAMLTVIMAIVAVALGITALLGNSINDFSRDIPFYKTRLKEQFGGLIPWLNSHGIELTRDQLLSYVNPGKAIQLVGDIFDGFGGVLTNALLIFLTVVLILFEAHSFPRKVRAAIDDPENKLERFDKFAQSLIRYLAIKTLTSLGTGITIGFWLAIMGVQYPVLWGLLAFLFNYVPNIGSIIAAVPAYRDSVRPDHRLVGRARLPGRQCPLRQRHRTAIHGPRTRALDAGGFSIAGVLGLGSRAGGHAAVGAAHHELEDCAGRKQGDPLAGNHARPRVQRACQRRRQVLIELK